MSERNLKIYNASLKISVVAAALWIGTLAVLLSDIIDSYSLTGTREGLMSSMISIGALAALLALIIFQGKYKKSQVIILCGILASVMLIVKGIPMPFTMFLLACFMMGFGHGAVDSCQSAFLADLNPGNTARHMGALHGLFGVGGVLTPVVLHELLKSFDWRSIYVIAGIVCLILIAQFAAVTRYMKSRISVATHIEPKLTLAGIKGFFGNRYSFFLVFCIFFGAAAQSGIIVWTIRYVSISLGSPETAALCLSVFWVSSTVSRFFCPMLKLAPSQILAYGAFGSAVIWTAALIINQPLGILAACAITGLASGSCIPMTLSEGAEMNAENTGFSTSILMMFKTIAQILSPIIVAFIMSVSSMTTAMYMTSLFFVINGLFAALMIRRKDYGICQDCAR